MKTPATQTQGIPPPGLPFDDEDLDNVDDFVDFDKIETLPERANELADLSDIDMTAINEVSPSRQARAPAQIVQVPASQHSLLPGSQLVSEPAHRPLKLTFRRSALKAASVPPASARPAYPEQSQREPSSTVAPDTGDFTYKVELILQVDKDKIAGTVRPVKYKQFKVFKWYSDKLYDAQQKYNLKGCDLERVSWQVISKAHRKQIGTHIINDDELDLKEADESLQYAHESGATDIEVKH